MMNVAVCVMTSAAPKETFINNHINHLPFNITLIYGGGMPYRAKGVSESVLVKLWFKFIDFTKGEKNVNISSFRKHQLKKIIHVKKIDVVFAEYLISGGFVTEICEKCKIPLIATALGFDISVNSIIDEHLTRYQSLFKHCSWIVVVSNHMRTRLHELGCDDDKIVYSPAGPDNSFFNLLPNFEKKQIFALGTFVDKKAPHLTILAFNNVLKKVPDATLILGGGGPLLGACIDLVNALGINDQVKFIGAISQEQQRAILSESLMFVQHSKVARCGNNEGTPVAILEACAAGLPIVSTFHAGIPEVVENGVTGFLVEEEDVHGMAEYMVKLLSDFGLAKKMGAAGKKYVAKNFSLKHHITKLSELIEKFKK